MIIYFGYNLKKVNRDKGDDGLQLSLLNLKPNTVFQAADGYMAKSKAISPDNHSIICLLRCCFFLQQAPLENNILSNGNNF
jgi:hypothetical protein